jgi:uncharacterized membrane protein
MFREPGTYQKMEPLQSEPYVFESEPPITANELEKLSSGRIRLSELLDETDAPEVTVRQMLDELELRGKLRRVAVGDHIVVMME